VSSIVPVFRDSGFDAEATQALGKAYAVACLSLHPSGQPPVVQEILAKKIIEVAQRGERNPDRLAAIALANLGSLHCEITRRLGLIPKFLHVGSGCAGGRREALGLRQIGLYRESHSLAFQGAVVRLPVALLPSPLLHRSPLRISGGLRPFIG